MIDLSSAHSECALVQYIVGNGSACNAMIRKGEGSQDSSKLIRGVLVKKRGTIIAIHKKSLQNNKTNVKSVRIIRNQ